MSNEIEAKETPIIEFKNVSKTYTLYKSSREQFSALFYHSKKLHKHKALNDVSFKIYKGESVGIVGNNGAGKSTLLKMITGVSFPDTGDIIVKGRVAALLELTAGFSNEMTGRFIFIFLTNRRLKSRQMCYIRFFKSSQVVVG